MVGTSYRALEFGLTRILQCDKIKLLHLNNRYFCAIVFFDGFNEINVTEITLDKFLSLHF